MKEEKNLDRLFQEKFKDFEQHPSDAVWARIAAAKKAEDEDRKIIPLWWKLGGAAAVIALLFTTGIVLFGDSSKDTLEDTVVTTTPNEKEGNTEQELNTPSKENGEVLFVDNTDEVSQDIENLENPNVQNVSEKTNSTASSNSQYSVAQNTTNSDTTAQTFSKGNTTEISVQAKNTVASNEQKENTHKENGNFDRKSIDRTLKNELDDLSAVTQTAQKDNSDTSVKIETNDQNKRSLIEEAQRIEESQKNDEAVAIVEEPGNTQRWDVGAIAAPIYYGDFGGSGLDPTFSDNTKSSDVNFSYGVQVSYAVSPKLKVRTGVSNVDLSYNTDGIAFTPNTNARRIPGITYSQNAQVLNITDRSATAASVNPRDGLLDNSNISTAVNGSLQQRIGFVEIPVEAVYVVSDKRLGVQVVGGLSTLLLNNNEVILNAADGLQSSLGTANGLNEVSFTTNIGLGLNYNMTDKLRLNVEPSLKYQLNAFDESVGDFKPYYVGLYTGVSFRF